MVSMVLACGPPSVAVYAQTDAIVTGIVRDETGGVLPGVSVDLQSGARRLAMWTDAAGTYRFESVPPGLVVLTFKLINFTAVRRELTVAAGQTTAANVVLNVSINADIVVTAPGTFRNVADLENPAENLVGVASAASQGAITARQLEARPVLRPGRSPRSRARADREPA